MKRVHRQLGRGSQLRDVAVAMAGRLTGLVYEYLIAALGGRTSSDGGDLPSH